ncbi:SGNH/GDSL hydrolase family protein [Actinomycetospora sp. NBRC 106378]|jgi:lysophospholipase L1-like esterase|uniref:SGNH/GDSL hydrolase family protein n=1 Tax=Actinomycetospora sp. NBRC 106378 TaxID=3032208 RepID=UPI0024A1E476|nr:SGNH/GDSL hydrolase family protein [Actinomycetospora sp. NBRC 106378]GLZ53114.1 lipase 2 [Actinomycetospora sp. NBRC 106378]
MGARRAVVAAAAVIGLFLVGTVAWANQAQPLRYVNLGDSYSSGAGIQPAAPGSAPACSQSQLNWAHDIAADTGATLRDASCSGADTQDFRTSQSVGVPPQLDAIASDTQLITLTIGGNDNNVFVSTIQKCATAALTTAGQGNPCQRTYGSSFVDTINTSNYPNIVRALQDVKKKAPKARVAISGYLRILPAEKGCYPIMPVAAGDVPYLNGIQGALNDAVKRAAAKTGVTYLDVTAISTGHDACQLPGVRWVEPVVPVNAAPVHPNAIGEREMANNAIAKLGLARA